LEQMGRWMKVNGKAIYGTSASPFGHPFEWGRCTEKTNADSTTLYLHVWDWPSDGHLLVPGLKNRGVHAHLLRANWFGWHKRLATVSSSDGVIVLLPGNAPDKISSTVVLTMTGAPEIE
jgi:alpha-L-fucosidase